jgi:hypothetical protein
MRFLIKLIMKIHNKIWCWNDAWGERQAFAKPAHFSNAFCNALDKPGTFIPFMFGSLVGHEMSRPVGGSWVPNVWKLLIFMLIPFAVLDLGITIFAFFYVFVIRFFVLYIIILPMKSEGAWEGHGYGWGNVTNPYLKEIWLEVDMEHDLYVAQNLLVTRELFQS